MCTLVANNFKFLFSFPIIFALEISTLIAYYVAFPICISVLQQSTLL